MKQVVATVTRPFMSHAHLMMAITLSLIRFRHFSLRSSEVKGILHYTPTPLRLQARPVFFFTYSLFLEFDSQVDHVIVRFPGKRSTPIAPFHAQASPRDQSLSLLASLQYMV